MRIEQRWMTVVGILVIFLVVLSNATGPVGFGTSGRPLALAIGVAVYVGAGAVFLLAPSLALAPTLLLLGTLAATSIAIHHADPSGPVVGLFLVAAFAPLRLPTPSAAAVAVAAVLAFNIDQLLTAAHAIVFALVTDGGAGFFFLLGWLLRREREQRELADNLLARLAASRDAERTAVALAERAHIARELHDVLAHTLSGLSLQLQGARVVLTSTGGDPEAVAAVERAHTLARDGLQEARQAISALRGEILPGPEALPALLEEHRRAGGQAVLTVTGDPQPLPPEGRLALYRAAQEALANVRRHAPRSIVDLRLAWSPDAALLTVDNSGPDDPRPADRRDEPGYGLTGMAERAQLLGGSVRAGPTDRGFRVELRLPVPVSTS